MAPSVGLGLVALAWFGGAVAAHWPRFPEVDGERWFKHLWQTRSEALGRATPLPWHPFARRPETRLLAPQTWVPPKGASAEEMAHVASLAAIPAGRARWDALWKGAPASGVDGLSWRASFGVNAAAPAAELASAIRGRSPFALFAVTDDETLGPRPLARAGALLGADVVPFTDVAATSAALVDRIANTETLPRVMLLGEGRGVHAILKALVEHPGLRDVTVGVGGLSAAIGGREGDTSETGETATKDWLARWFDQLELDTEALAAVPYASMAFVDPDAWPVGRPGLPLANTRFPEPRDGGAPHACVVPLDFGVSVDDVDLDDALLSFVATLIAIHRHWAD